MSDSVGDVRAELAAVAELIGSAAQFTGLARTRINEAVEVLAGLGEHHSESLVPEELRRAADEVDHSLRLIQHLAAVMVDIDARL